jgi:hypothetical protein
MVEQDGHFEQMGTRAAYVPISTLLEFNIVKLSPVNGGDEKLIVQMVTAEDDAVQNLNMTIDDGIELVRRMIWQLGGFGHPMCRELCKVCWPEEDWD